MNIDGSYHFHKMFMKLYWGVRVFLKPDELYIPPSLSDSFVERYTNYTNAHEMISKSGFKLSSKADFDAIPSDEWNSFISNSTVFDNWNAMLNAANLEHTARDQR